MLDPSVNPPIGDILAHGHAFFKMCVFSHPHGQRSLVDPLISIFVGTKGLGQRSMEDQWTIKLPQFKAIKKTPLLNGDNTTSTLMNAFQLSYVHHWKLVICHWELCKSSIEIDLHCSFTDARPLPKTRTVGTSCNSLRATRLYDSCKGWQT